jgi:ATP-dependent RNA helicase DeaD
VERRRRRGGGGKGERRDRTYGGNDRPAPRDAPGKPGGRFQSPPGSKTRLFINLGRKDRIRPGDLVGAIANESELTGKDIGPINVTETFSTVDVRRPPPTPSSTPSSARRSGAAGQHPPRSRAPLSVRPDPGRSCDQDPDENDGNMAGWASR